MRGAGVAGFEIGPTFSRLGLGVGGTDTPFDKSICAEGGGGSFAGSGSWEFSSGGDVPGGTGGGVISGGGGRGKGGSGGGAADGSRTSSVFTRFLNGCDASSSPANPFRLFARGKIGAGLTTGDQPGFKGDADGDRGGGASGGGGGGG